jgi:hypothetical protein
VKMKTKMTLSPAPLAALQLDDLQAVSGGEGPLDDPTLDEETRQQSMKIAESLRGQGDNKLGQ